MSDQDFDYGDDVDEPIGDNLLAAIKETAAQQEDAEEHVEFCQEELEKAQKELNRISMEVLPELMSDAETMDHTSDTGLRIQMAEKIRAAIPKDNEMATFAWMEANGHAHLIKRQIIIEFGRDEEAWAKKFMADCAKRKKKLNMKVKRTVHNQTLVAFIKDQLQKGVDIPAGLFSIFRQKFTKISR